MDVFAADPFVLYDKVSGYYYCYATISETSQRNDKAFFIYKSKDKTNWEFVDYVFDLNKIDSWAKDWFWAPECYYNEHNKHYYLFYSARVKDNLLKKYFNSTNYEEGCKIGVAVSKSPEGPFINLSDKPLDYYPFDSNYIDLNNLIDKPFELKDKTILNNSLKGKHIPIIDVNLLIEDKRIILYYSRCCYMNCNFDDAEQKFIEESNINAVELNTDWWFDLTASTMPTIKDNYKFIDKDGLRKDKYVEVLSYKKEPQKWENRHINDYELYNKNRPNRRWAEGSTIFKLNRNGNDIYCLTYSCNYYMDPYYGVGIAFSNDPLIGFKKYENNPIISQIDDKVYSTGHGSLVMLDNNMYYFLHGRKKDIIDRLLCYTTLKIESSENVTTGEIIFGKLINK